MQCLALTHTSHTGAPPQVKNVLALDYCLADELSVPVRQLVDGMLQINPDDRAAACSLTKRALAGAPSRLRTAALGAPQQSQGRLSPAVQPRSLFEAPPKTPMSRPLPPRLQHDRPDAGALGARLGRAARR